MSVLDTLVIEAGRAEKHYWRDIAVRYKHTVIGILWALLQPLLTMVVFGRIAKLPSRGMAPYAVLVYAGMLPLEFFARALSGASGSLSGITNLVGKV